MAKPAKGKKFVKVVRNAKTGRTKRVSYGASGYKISPGTSKGDSYCARSYGIKKEMLNKGGASAKKARDPNSPNNLSRKNGAVAAKGAENEETRALRQH
jgi:hypothetical protein